MRLSTELVFYCLLQSPFLLLFIRGASAEKVNWIVSDITEFEPNETFEVWHDRAAFHFLTNKEQIEKYMRTARKSVSGYLTVGTFSENGPKNAVA